MPRGLVCPARKVTVPSAPGSHRDNPVWDSMYFCRETQGRAAACASPQDLPGACLCFSGSVYLNNDPGHRTFHKTDGRRGSRKEAHDLQHYFSIPMSHATLIHSQGGAYRTPYGTLMARPLQLYALHWPRSHLVKS